MAKKMRIGVIFGGRSGEHEVSVRSARAVIEALDGEKYEVIPIAITKEGKWLAPARAARLLPDATRARLSEKILKSDAHAADAVAIIADPSQRGLITLESDNEDVSPTRALDVIFPVLHGTYGEDGTIQGLLEMADVAYVGCGVLASSCGMDKVTMKALFREAGLPICKHIWFLRTDFETDPARIVRRIKREIGFPCFVKPANLGSSVGISRASDQKTLEAAINLAARYDRKIIVEEGLDVREIECAVIGNDKAEASLPGEYVVHDEAARFLDYTEKYTSTGHVDFVVPAPLAKPLLKRIQKMAVRAFQAIDGAGFARVDFFLRRDTNELLINELNTIPGLTEVSGYPKMWQASGRSLAQIIDRLIELAVERHNEKSRNVTSL
jgi:D-alanine-D-alanine ligase